MAVDYAALAKKNGGSIAPTPAAPPASGQIDYAALAKAQGGSASTPAQAPQAPNIIRDSLIKGPEKIKGAIDYGMGIASHALEGFTRNVADTGAAITSAGVQPTLKKKALGAGVAVERGILGPLTTATEALFTPVGDAIKMLTSKISDIPVVQRLAMSDSVGRVLHAAKDAGQTLDQLKVNNPDLAPDVENVANLLLLVTGEPAAKTGARVVAETGTSAVKAVSQKVIEPVARTSADLTREGASKIADAGTKATETLTAPFKGSYKPDVAEAFARQGIEAPASAVTSSKAVQSAEAVAQHSLFGSGVTRVIENARKSIYDITESLRKEVNPEKLITPGATPETTGRVLQDAVAKVRETFNKTKTQLYEDASSKIGSQQADLAETRKTLESIIEEKAKSLDPTTRNQTRFYQQILNATRTAEKRTFDHIKQTRTDIGSKLRNRVDPITTGDAANLKRVYAALSEDLDRTVMQSGAEGAAALKAATEYYKAGIQRINSFVGRTIYNSKSPELIVGKLVKPGDISTIRELKGLVGEEAHHTFAAALVNRIVGDTIMPLTGRVSASKLSTILSKYGDEFLTEAIGAKALAEIKDLRKAAIIEDILDRGTKEGKVMPSALAHAIDSYSETVLKDAFTPEELAKIRDVQKMSEGMAKGTKMAEGSPTAFNGDLILTGIVGYVSVPALIAKLGFQFGLTKLVTSRLGKKLLSGGLGMGSKTASEAVAGAEKVSEAVSGAKASPVAEQAAKIGGQEGVYRYSEKPTGSVPPVLPETSTNPYRGNTHELFSAMAVIQTDKDGNIKFNPLTALAGIVGSKIVGAGKITSTVDDIVTNLPHVSAEDVTWAKVFGSSANGASAPHDIDVFVAVREGAAKFPIKGGLPAPIVKNVGKVQYFIMPESDAQDLLDAMLYVGRKEKGNAGKTINITSAFKKAAVPSK